MKLFNYAKWIPLTIYDYQGNKYLLMGRKNLNSGMISFRNKRLNSIHNLLHENVNTLDIKEQFEKLYAS